MTTIERANTPAPTVTDTCRHCGGSIYRYTDNTTWWHQSTYAVKCRSRRDGSTRPDAAPTQQ